MDILTESYTDAVAAILRAMAEAPEDCQNAALERINDALASSGLAVITKTAQVLVDPR